MQRLIRRLFDLSPVRRRGGNSVGRDVEGCEARVYLSAQVFTVPEASVGNVKKGVDPQVAFPEDYNGTWSVTPQGEPSETLLLNVKGSKVTGEFVSTGALEGAKFKGKLGGPDGVTLTGSTKIKVNLPVIGKGKLEININVGLDTDSLFFGTYETYFRKVLDSSGTVTGEKLT